MRSQEKEYCRQNHTLYRKAFVPNRNRVAQFRGRPRSYSRVSNSSSLASSLTFTAWSGGLWKTQRHSAQVPLQKQQTAVARTGITDSLHLAAPPRYLDWNQGNTFCGLLLGQDWEVWQYEGLAVSAQCRTPLMGNLGSGAPSTLEVPWDSGHSGEETGTPREEQDIERIQGRGDLGLPLYSPRRMCRRLGCKDSDLSDEQYLYSKVLCCDCGVLSRSFSSFSEAIPSRNSLMVFPNPPSWVTRGIWLDIFILQSSISQDIQKLLVSCLSCLPPRQNSHVASQTLKIKWKSSCCAGWNLLSWKVPASTPASW